MTDNVIDTPTLPSATDRERAVDALLSAAVLAADRRREAQAQREAARDAAIKRAEREEREKMAERLTEILTRWTLAVPELTADNIGEAGWEILPELYLAPNGPNIRVYDVAEGTRIVASLADLGDAIRAHQAEQARLEQLEKAEQEMAQKEPSFSRELRVFLDQNPSRGIVLKPAGSYLTLRPFASRDSDGGQGVSLSIPYISAREARALADGIISVALRREPHLITLADEYIIVCTATALTFLDNDSARTLTINLDTGGAFRDQFVTTLQEWADYADALAAWQAECHNRGLTDY